MPEESVPSPIAAAEKRDSEERYSPEWFEQRAFASLKRIEGNTWDFSDSLLLYVPGAEDSYEELQKTETPYHRLVTQPEREYLQEIAEQIVSELPSEFDYIDLGPGTEHKEQFIFDAAKQQGKKFRYIPVDISGKFLEMSRTYAEGQDIPTLLQQVPFEELAQTLGDSSRPRFVSLGLTYSNYASGEILELLKNIAGPEGQVFINSQMRDRVDMDEIRRIYKDDALALTKSKIRLLDLNFDSDVESVETDDGIRVWCTLKNSNPRLEHIGITPGAKLLMFQSLRSTKEELERNVQSHFETHLPFDTNGSFIGVLLGSKSESK